jgi:hypothetical protein
MTLVTSPRDLFECILNHAFVRRIGSNTEERFATLLRGCGSAESIWVQPDSTFIPTQQLTSHTCQLYNNYPLRYNFPKISSDLVWLRRLLVSDHDGEFSLINDLFGDDIPQCAILSHTWGADTEEVTFRDLMDGTGKSKASYNKIRFCGEQASRDDLRYFR